MKKKLKTLLGIFLPAITIATCAALISLIETINWNSIGIIAFLLTAIQFLTWKLKPKMLMQSGNFLEIAGTLFFVTEFVIKEDAMKKIGYILLGTITLTFLTATLAAPKK